MNRGRRVFTNQVMACCIYPFSCNTKFGFIGAPGVSIRQSPYSARETIDRIESFLARHHVAIYARVNQEAGIVSCGQPLFHSELLLFGSPVGGGTLMAENPLIALDLPLKVIAWQDGDQKIWLAYNDGAYLEKRYGLPHNPGSTLHLDHLIGQALI